MTGFHMKCNIALKRIKKAIVIAIIFLFFLALSVFVGSGFHYKKFLSIN